MEAEKRAMLLFVGERLLTKRERGERGLRGVRSTFPQSRIGEPDDVGVHVPGRAPMQLQELLHSRRVPDDLEFHPALRASWESKS